MRRRGTYEWVQGRDVESVAIDVRETEVRAVLFVPPCDKGRYGGIDGAWENHGDIRSDISAGRRYDWWRWEEA